MKVSYYLNLIVGGEQWTFSKFEMDGFCMRTKISPGKAAFRSAGRIGQTAIDPPKKPSCEICTYQRRGIGKSDFPRLFTLTLARMLIWTKKGEFHF